MLIDFSTTPLGVTQVNSLSPVRTQQGTSKLAEALDSFSMSFGGSFPMVTPGQRGLDIGSATLTRVRDIPPVIVSCHLIASSGLQLLYPKDGQAAKVMSGDFPLEKSSFAEAVRSAFGEGASGWYVCGDLTEGLRQGVIFLNSDGRILSLIQSGQGHGEHFLVGLGVMGAAMCYIEVADSRYAGEILAVFGMRSVVPSSVDQDFVDSLRRPIEAYYQTTQADCQVGVLNESGDNIDAISGESPFNIVTTMSVASHACYPVWKEDPDASATPIACVSYHPPEVGQERGLLLTALYRPMNNARSVADVFPNILAPLRETFVPR